MGYGLFAQQKLNLNSRLNSHQLMQTQRSNEQFKLANEHTGLDQELSSLSTSQATELSFLYEKLSEASDDKKRQKIQSMIESLKLQHTAQQDRINREIYTVGMRENAIEMEVKHLDTAVTAIQTQLQAVEDAEAKSVERATPKFGGMG